MSGRLSLLVNRENNVSIIFSFGCHDVSLRLCPVIYDKWTNIVVTFDGCSVRGYVDALLKLNVEIAELLALKERIRQQEISDKKTSFRNDEKAERDSLMEKKVAEAEKFFLSKEGPSYLKRSAQDIMESADFQSENIGKEDYFFLVDDKFLCICSFKLFWILS